MRGEGALERPRVAARLHDERDQAYVCGIHLGRDHDALRGEPEIDDGPLDADELDAHAADLDLIVAPAEHLQVPAVVQPSDVPGAIEDLPIERAKPLFAQLCPCVVARDDAGTRDQDLAYVVRRDVAQIRADHAQRHAGEGLADEARLLRVVTRERIAAAHAADLRAAVDDEQLGSIEHLLHALHHGGRDDIAAGRGMAHVREAARGAVTLAQEAKERRQQAGAGVHDRDGLEQRRERAWIEHALALHEAHGASRAQG